VVNPIKVTIPDRSFSSHIPAPFWDDVGQRDGFADAAMTTRHGDATTIENGLPVHLA